MVTKEEETGEILDPEGVAEDEREARLIGELEGDFAGAARRFAKREGITFVEAMSKLARRYPELYRQSRRGGRGIAIGK